MTQHLGMPGMAPMQAAPVAQAAPAMAQPAAIAAAPVEAPAAQEVAQLALPADFNIAAFAVAKVASTGTPRKKPVEDCTMEELRERVTFRDVQGPNKDGVNYHVRPCLHPKILDVHAATQLTDPTTGAPANTIIVPLAYKDSIEAYLRQLVGQGYFDAELDRARKEIVADKIAKEAEAKKAPVDTAAADSALSELQAVQATGPAMQATGPAMQPAMQPAMPAQMAAAAPAQQPAMPGMPTMPGMPGMPGL